MVMSLILAPRVSFDGVVPICPPLWLVIMVAPGAGFVGVGVMLPVPLEGVPGTIIDIGLEACAGVPVALGAAVRC